VRRRLTLLAVIVLCIVMLMLGGQFVVKPEHELDLIAEPIDVKGKVIAMILNRKLEVVLTNQDLTNLAKKQLASQPEVDPKFRITGLALEIHGSELTAEVNGWWRNRVKVGATGVYALAWNNGTIAATPRVVRIKRLQVPSRWIGLEPIEIPINDLLPSLVKIDQVQFEESAIRMHFALR
jgi:hypothetical protein